MAYPLQQGLRRATGQGDGVPVVGVGAALGVFEAGFEVGHAPFGLGEHGVEPVVSDGDVAAGVGEDAGVVAVEVGEFDPLEDASGELFADFDLAVDFVHAGHDDGHPAFVVEGAQGFQHAEAGGLAGEEDVVEFVEFAAMSGENTETDNAEGLTERMTAKMM